MVRNPIREPFGPGPVLCPHDTGAGKAEPAGATERPPLCANDAGRGNADPASPTEPAPFPFDEDIFLDLLEMMGRERMSRLLDHLLQALRAEAAAQDFATCERDRLAGDLHGLVSAAGMLGFRALSAACRALEDALRSGADPTAAVIRFRDARDQAIRQIASLKRVA